MNSTDANGLASRSGCEVERPATPSIEACVDLLNQLAASPDAWGALTEDQRIALSRAAGVLSRPNRDEIRVRNKKIESLRRKSIVAADRKARATTGIREARLNSVFVAPAFIEVKQISASGEEVELNSARNCYVCKAEFTKLHHFYDTMCAKCAEFNYSKRFQSASLEGQVAVITGGRLKIGYQAAIMMLKAGARVIVTTRFPVDAAARFSREPDFHVWGDRVEVYGLDLRHTPSVEIFTRYLETKLDRLDILINNAAQTVRRPPGFYAHMMATETQSYASLSEPVRKILKAHEACKTQLGAFSSPEDSNSSGVTVRWQDGGAGLGLRHSAQLSQVPYSYDSSLTAAEVFPEGRLDADLQQVDLRHTNSWRMKLADVPIPEMMEVQLVNAIAPFVLCSRLAPLMRRDNTGCKHIVNVTAMEGKFYRFTKTDRHPHTNMAKAALNMMTHTSASDLAKDGIFMNAVDTGWVTDEDPAHLSERKQDIHDFQPPLDIVDGAARVCDPFFHGILTGSHWCGKFLKDYFPSDW